MLPPHWKHHVQKKPTICLTPISSDTPSGLTYIDNRSYIIYLKSLNIDDTYNVNFKICFGTGSKKCEDTFVLLN